MKTEIFVKENLAVLTPDDQELIELLQMWPQLPVLTRYRILQILVHDMIQGRMGAAYFFTEVILPRGKGARRKESYFDVRDRRRERISHERISRADAFDKYYRQNGSAVNKPSDEEKDFP